MKKHPCTGHFGLIKFYKDEKQPSSTNLGVHWPCSDSGRIQNILPERTAAFFSNGRMFFIFANEI
jgi:hypothetical protein